MPHPQRIWEDVTVITVGDEVLLLATGSNANTSSIREIAIDDVKNLPPLRSPVELTALSYLHQPDVLHSLEVR